MVEKNNPSKDGQDLKQAPESGEDQEDIENLEHSLEEAFSRLSAADVKKAQDDFLERFASGKLTEKEKELLAQLQAELPQGDYSMKAKNPNILQTKTIRQVPVDGKTHH